MKTLFLALTLLTAMSASANPKLSSRLNIEIQTGSRLGNPANISRIAIGGAHNERQLNTQQRIDLLERAVRQLQNKVYELEEDRVSQTHTSLKNYKCTLDRFADPENRFIGYGASTRDAAEAASANCKDKFTMKDIWCAVRHVDLRGDCLKVN